MANLVTDFDYPAFLAARLDELEAQYRDAESRRSPANPWPAAYTWFLADIAAKRAILTKLEIRKEFLKETDWDGVNQLHHQHYISSIKSLEWTVKHLCHPFADHPGYRGER